MNIGDQSSDITDIKVTTLPPDKPGANDRVSLRVELENVSNYTCPSDATVDLYE